MPTTARPAPDVQELLAAYQTLDLPPRASPLAVRLRYRELAQIHHPDKWPNGSAEQVAATERMCEINAAYLLIEDAPLQHRPIPAETTVEPVHERNWLARVDLDPVRFLYGTAAGGALSYWLHGGQVQNDWYSWLLAIAMGIVFARTSWVSNRLLEGIIGSLPRR